jgi:hypothetical protein
MQMLHWPGREQGDVVKKSTIFSSFSGVVDFLTTMSSPQEVIDTHLRWLLQHNPDELAEVHCEVKTQLEAFMQT